MHDLAFYNAGCDELRGFRRVVVPVRRLLRRVLLPIFQHQEALFRRLIDRLDQYEAALGAVHEDGVRLGKRQDVVDEKSEAVLAFGWDYVALVRRLAVLEDQVASLTGQATPSTDVADPRASILFPGRDASHEARTKVS